MIEILAAAASQPTTGYGGGAYNFVHFWLPLIAVMIFMWAVMILPKRKQDKQRQHMLETMKRGDEVETIGGIIGKVVDARPDRVLVKVDESSNSKIWFRRTAIARVVEEDAKVPAGTK